MALSDLSDIAFAVNISAVTAMLALRQTSEEAFRTAVVTFLENEFPAATLATSDFDAGKIAIMIDPTLGYVGFGRGMGDALAAIRNATTP